MHRHAAGEQSIASTGGTPASAAILPPSTGDRYIGKGNLPYRFLQIPASRPYMGEPR
jgi:hypothetical protein